MGNAAGSGRGDPLSAAGKGTCGVGRSGSGGKG